MLGITSIRHPDYFEVHEDFIKWRLTYRGGAQFVNTYLRKLSTRESDTDFDTRKLITYCPAFAAASVDEVKNSIYTRMSDITRTGGSDKYQKCILGLNGGVDLDGKNMNTFIGDKVLEELLSMRRVGVLVDNSADIGETLADSSNVHPYLTYYQRENILSWSYVNIGNTKKLKTVLLQETYDTEDEQTGLVSKSTSHYRYMRRTDSGIEVIFYSDTEEIINRTLLKIPEIPFHIIEINRSLLHNIADYQIALMNLESADIAYAMKSNYPMYYEYFDPKTEIPYGKPVAAPGDTGTSAEAVAKQRETKVGGNQGRRFQQGLQPPGFINPSPETLVASMAKGNQIKADIRTLINLNLQNIGQQRQSAESKEEDRRGLESSLSYIGLMLENAENRISVFWSYFDDSKPATVVYPKDYSLKSDADRVEEAEKCEEAARRVPSKTFQRLMLKHSIKLQVGHLVTDDVLRKMYTELDSVPTLNTEAKEILEDHKAGLVSDKTASIARGYAEDEHEIAQKEREERLKMQLAAQTQGLNAARGIPEAGGPDGSDEKDGKSGRGANKLPTAKESE